MFLWLFLQSSVIKELEGRVQMLMVESDQNSKARSAVERDKMQIECKLERQMKDYRDVKDRYTLNHDT